ncbi:MAG: helix-turn-helix transcriptional regulator [Ruminococcaceae bacterium]|nr:helix-turn-helix transcriptional regulator [Oscillospiraceae bacterium]
MDNKVIGNKIKERRKELNISQEKLAEMVGYSSRSSINKIEMGTRDFPRSLVIKFAKALNVSPSWLLGEVETDDDFIAALGEIKPLGELPSDVEAINIFAESFGERIIKVDDNLFFGECGMLSDDELNYIKSSAGDAIKFAYDQIKKKRLSSLF